ncbi:ABC transporter substrate-binding protein [Chroogloeocystis siderophila]|jgi:NitT/TauT family transport system substrate-binding protein|uniref:Nitrate ABC transporter substrate-binding protein n=1 Tax=Chroogloeocystis siderophila 5.2 s.c.1 TaxID=247279 RepID=A0A1U7HQP5_9CHRO|nr:ABC transporter substrate-binding protein [Chroogloeocystis siderophila]OKH25868.1 nitrate ABC transporter substrate-binding protein [Chroogloeocystis siderophila 5.2 s.c.1]
MYCTTQLKNDKVNRRKFLQYGLLFIGSSVVAACTNNQSQVDTSQSNDLDRVTFGTNWVAQAEHGGFYQAIATGIYKEHGLDVTIQMGGPQVPTGTQLLMGNAVDFFMGYGVDAVNAVAEGIPKITVAAIFQKDPQCLIAHPNTGVDSIEDLRGRPIYISSAANVTYWPLLAAKFGFTDDQKRPYNFNPGPFLADKQSAQQGYITSEPFAIERQGGFTPVVFLLADYGYIPYSTTIETRRELVKNNPDLVQRFVDASIKGWYSYLENPAPGNELIKQANPEMTDEQIAYGLDKLQEYGIINSGEVEQLGIGAMSEERWQSFFNTMTQAGVFKPNIEYKQAFTLQFVNKGAQAYRG